MPLIKQTKPFSYILLLLAIFLFVATNATQSFGQKYNFVNYNVENGLAQSQVTDIIQDKNNELWIGTYGGISLFDGSNFINYNKSNGLPNNLVWSLDYGKDGTIWISTPAGITAYDGRNFKNYPIPDNSADNITAEIQVDHQGGIWALARSKVYKFRDQKFEAVPGLDSVTAMVADHEGNMIFARFRQGIIKLKNNQTSLYVSMPADFVIGIWAGKKSGNLYCFTNAGIKVIANGTTMPPDWLPPVPLAGFNTRIFEDSHGNIWLNLMDGGAWMYANKKWVHYTYANGLCDDNVNNFFEDREGNVWIATNGSGMYRYSGNIFTYYDRSSGLTSSSVMCIGEHSDNGELFMGTSSGGLYQIKNNVPQKIKLQPEISNITSLATDPQGNLLIGSVDAGLWQYRNGKIKPVLLSNGATVMTVYALHEHGKTIWLSSATGLCKLIDGQITPINSPVKNIHALQAIGDDTLLLGTVQGAYIYHISTGITEEKPLLPDANVLCFTTDHNNIYIGTDDRGVVVWNKSSNKITSISKKDGLSCDYVYSLLRDKKGNIWAGTGCGIDRITFANSITKIKSFGKSDGLQGVENNANAAFQDRSGSLWFGTTKGVFRFDPDATPTKNRAPIVVLQTVKLFSREIPQGKYTDSIVPFTGVPWRPVFSPGQNHLSFTFKGIHLSNPEKVRYRYQLIGADHTYTETDQTSVIYPSLPAGDYEFKVWASDGEGNWYDNADSYRFTIQAPFYKTTYFIIGALLLTIGLFLAAVYYRNKQRTRRMQWEQKLREEEQARVRQRTAEDFHDEIGNKLTRINLLATIAEGKLKNSRDDVQEIIRQIQTNVGSLYNGSKDIIWSLQPYSDYLDEILLRIRQNATEMLQGSSVKFSYCGPEEIGKPRNIHVQLPIDYSRNMIMIFKEAINNIAKHSAASHITMWVKWQSEQELTIGITDDGKGYDEATITKGNGLNNMKSRSERIGGLLVMKSKPGAGSSLSLTLKIPN
jgi:ligand-binding sensor domain-containing protein/signal transduction histidine kinase